VSNHDEAAMIAASIIYPCPLCGARLLARPDAFISCDDGRHAYADGDGEPEVIESRLSN
jgi:hypothetical protein